MIDKASHVLSQINSLSSRFDPKNKGDHVMVKCPFHAGGNERTPSCGINLSKPRIPVGVFNCLACKTNGSWNKFAAATGLKGFKAADQINDVYSFTISDTSKKENQKIKKEDYNNLPYWPKNKIWRKIEPRIVRLYEGSLPENPWFEDDFLYFPVVINNDYVGGIYARKIVSKKTKAEGLPSYINTSGAWMKQALFGYNIAKKQRGPLWIEEGPRDVMKTRQVGGRAVGLCGAYISDRKIRLIEALDPPVIVIATDPDEAGNKARETLKKKLSNFPLIDAEFPNNYDPGNFTKKSYYKMCVKLGLKKC